MEININRFYIIGMTCFMVVAVFTWANLVMIMDSLTFPSVIATSAQIVFNFTLVGFFYYLYKQNNKPNTLDQTLLEVEQEIKDSGF